MFRFSRHKFLAAISSMTVASIRCNTSLLNASAAPERGPNLLKEPVTPTKTAICNRRTTTAIKTDTGVYDNSDSSTVVYQVEPPIAKQQATITRLPWDTTVDNYAWLRDKESAETISYLNAENAYTDYKMQHTKDLQALLYSEILTRIVEDDQSVPAKRDNFMYYTRTEKGKAYRIYCRKPIHSDSEQVLLDVNALAENKAFMDIGTYAVSPDHAILAYSTDEKGDEIYNLVFQDLRTGQLLADGIANICDMEWSADNTAVFYTKHDETWRPYQVWKHVLGDEVKNDVLLLEESDPKFTVAIERTRDDRFMLVHVGSAITDEVWFMDANVGTGKAETCENAEAQVLQCIKPREHGVEYSVDHQGDDWLILMNDDGAINFQLYAVKDKVPQVEDKRTWTRIIEHDEDVTLRSVNCFKDFIVLSQRRAGLPEYRIRYKSADNTVGEHVVEMPEASYDIWSSDNLEYDTKQFRFQYTSLVTPTTTFDYAVNRRQLQTRKVQPVNEYDASKYQTKRLWATAVDGTQIPISLIALKDADLDGGDGNTPIPVHLVGYGSYGSSEDVYFSVSRLSLVDRGVAVGFAHIRGGGEFGRKWKLDGKLQKKRNTFQDFIACSQHLVDVGVTDCEHLTICGGSAGGLLMGSVMNMRPDLFKAVIADVPFVDVINTMLDASIPLTAGEWEEWGDPRTMEDYWYIKSYSPYNNISTAQYPNVLLEGGLNDSRVKYWEPAKFCAKLREIKRQNQHLYDQNRQDNTILLKTIMAAGHGGSSGRYARIKEVAFEYAFLLHHLGLLNVANENLKVKVKVEKESK